MKTTITKSILMALALIAIAPSANAQIASKEYVDELGDKHDKLLSMMWGEVGAQIEAMSKEEIEQTLESMDAAGGMMGIVLDGNDTMGITALSELSSSVSGLETTVGDTTMTTTAQTVTGAVNELKTAVDGKMDSMTVDSTPTQNSTNLVTSGGVATAIAAATPTVDATPTANSDNLVTSGGVYDAIDTLAGDVEDLFINKQDALGDENNTGVVVATSTPGSVTYTGIDSTPTANSDNLVTSGGVYDALGVKADNVDLDKAVGMKQNYYNSFVVTDNSGNVKVATGAYVTNDKVASNAAIEMGKIALPTPPAACDTYGCILMRYNNKYVWEMVTRNNGETISDTGGVNVAATATSNSLQGALPSSCQGIGASWNGTTCAVEK